jgi:DNA polymerase-3 subunit epsilon
VAHVGGGESTEVRQWLVDPGVDIPAEATAVHGISTEQARTTGARPAVALAEIAAAVVGSWRDQVPVVAFNATYDFTVLDRDLRRHALGGLVVGGPVIDPYVLDRKVDRFRRGGRTLTAVCQYYRVALNGAHDATADAVAAGRVAWRIATLHPSVASMPPPVLHAAQVRWHREQQEDFAAYLRRSGKSADDVCLDWPIRPIPSSPTAVTA